MMHVVVLCSSLPFRTSISSFLQMVRVGNIQVLFTWWYVLYMCVYLPCFSEQHQFPSEISLSAVILTTSSNNNRFKCIPLNNPTFCTPFDLHILFGMMLQLVGVHSPLIAMVGSILLILYLQLTPRSDFDVTFCYIFIIACKLRKRQW